MSTKDFHTFQARVGKWLIQCFGNKIADSKKERTKRFMEESLELVQACGMSKEEVLQFVEWVYSRKEGEIYQEVGGVCVTLASLCRVQGVRLTEEAEKELARAYGKMDEIRHKHRNKPL